MTRQEMFDRAVTGILKQGRFAAHGTTCCYRLDPTVQVEDDGEFYPPEAHYAAAPLRCAVGQLIPDDQYYVRLEGEMVANYRVRSLLGLTDEDAEFLQQLQEVHDNSARDGVTMDEFKVRAREFALEHNLSIEVLDQ